MKRVLILCHDYPPLQSASALRLASWANYMPDHGLFPVVIARKWPDGISDQEDKFGSVEQNEILEEESRELHLIAPRKTKRDLHIEKYGLNKGVTKRRFLSFGERLESILSKDKGSNDFLYQYAKKYLQSKKVDLIIASGGPFELFKYASLLSEEFGIPWIADYRDEMRKNHSLNLQAAANRWLMKLEGLMENRWTNSAAAITTVSGPLAQRISDSTSKQTHVVRNGTEMLDVPEIEDLKKEFVLLYTGTVYHSEYIEFLDEALQSFFSEGKDNVRICFVGTDLNRTEGTIRLKSMMKKYGEIVSFLPAVKHHEILNHIARSTVCLNLVPGSMAGGIYPVKLYDYLSMDKPVINVETEKSEMRHDFADYTIDVHDALGLLRSLEELYTTWESGKPLINKVPEELKESFDRKYQCGILAKIIDEVISNEKQIEE